MRRGVRQDDPLSLTLFILCIECLASALRNSTDFVGLTLGDSTVKASLFGDDTMIFLMVPRANLNMCMKSFKILLRHQDVELIGINQKRLILVQVSI